MEKLTMEEFLNSLEIGQYFIYKNEQGYYRKGLKVSKDFSIPIGGLCKTVQGAEKEY